MAFFKKNKTSKDKESMKPTPEEIKQDIAKMDSNRNLDQQIKDLTSKLNISPIDEPTPEPSRQEALKTNALTSQPLSEDSGEDVDMSAFQIDAPHSDSKRLNMEQMRMDVARISSDIQGGEELYRRALQRVEGLMGQVEKAEVDFSVLNRLEPENRRLKARLRTAQSELEGSKSKLSLISTDLENHQERLDEKTVQYEQSRVKLVSATKTLHEYDRALKQSKTDIERHTLALERNKTALSVEGRENKVLREKISELSEAVDARQTEFLEASKTAESLRVDCDEFRKQAETYRSQAQDLRITLSTAKRQNNSMKGEMLALHDDIKTFKTQYEFNVIGREDQVADLEVQLSTLSKELDLKANISDKHQGELSKIRRIRAHQDIERDRLEKALDAAKAELADVTKLKASENSQQVTLLKKDVRDLQNDLRRREELFDDAKNETETLRRQLTSADIEQEKLQTKIDLQLQNQAQLEKNNPVPDLEVKIEQLTKKLKIKDEIVKSAEHDLNAFRELQSDLQRREELFEEAQNETETLRRQLALTNIEHEKLQTKLDLQLQEQPQSKKNNSVSDLEVQVEQLTKKLKIKDEIVQSAAHDLNVLREDREAQSAENKRLADQIYDQNYQLEETLKALLESKNNETDLDQRYRDVAAALSLNNTRRKSGNVSKRPDINSDINSDINPDSTNETPSLNEDDIEKRILDYKFGISNKII